MKKYRITKYNPKNSNVHGHYLYDHWTEISDVGRKLEGEIVTQEEYFRIEKDYINAVVEILKDSNQEYLRLIGLNQDGFQEALIENSNEWYHESIFENLNLCEDQIINIEDIPTVIKLNLRRYLDATLEIKDKYYVQFGYDFYMYVGTPKLSNKLIDKLNATSVYIEEYLSPYYSPKLEYIVQSNKKGSMYVEEEQILSSFTIEKMKEIYKLSKEHSGRIYAKINKEIAEKIGIKVDLEKYDYSLITELK